MFGDSAATEAATHSAIIDLRNISSLLNTTPPRNVDASATVPFLDVVMAATKCPNTRLTSARPTRTRVHPAFRLKAILGKRSERDAITRRCAQRSIPGNVGEFTDA